ncbi:MAG: response regulator [Gammaproteobacteria bacterium]|nr:response regulator [Gammaproteobacteria bacterium]
MNATSPSILIVEDEAPIRRMVRNALEREGCRVAEAARLTTALVSVGEQRPDLVILDLGFPDGDGTQFIRDMRIWSHIPVLVLTARSTEHDKIDALDAGADDYLTKPFSVGELLARTRALLRRAHAVAGATESRVCFGDVEIDLSRRTLIKAGAAIHLTALEYRLLSTLIANAGRVMTHRQLLREVWGPGNSESATYLRVYIGRLRQKLERDPAQPRHFQTEIGVGYRFQL